MNRLICEIRTDLETTPRLAESGSHFWIMNIAANSKPEVGIFSDEIIELF
jgi:hypothetical protein